MCVHRESCDSINPGNFREIMTSLEKYNITLKRCYTSLTMSLFLENYPLWRNCKMKAYNHSCGYIRYTVDAGYKIIVGNCIQYYYDRHIGYNGWRYKNTFGSRKYVRITYIHYVLVYEKRFQTMVYISSMFL